MSKEFDHARMNGIIQSSTSQIIERTESFIKTVETVPAGPGAVSLMVNGKELAISQENYALLKAQTDLIKSKRKEEIKAQVSKFKETAKSKLGGSKTEGTDGVENMSSTV